MENDAMANKKKIDLPYSFSHPKKLKEGNKNKTRDSKYMKNRLLPEILFMFDVFLIIFNKDRALLKTGCFYLTINYILLNYFILLR